MRKSLVLAVVLTLAALVSAGQAAAAPSPKATGGVTATSGSGTVKGSFNAQGTPTDAKGHFRFEFLSGPLSGQFYDGEVSCYDQSGNVGVLGGFVAQTNNSTITFIRITVQDNGEGSKASGPDLIRVQRFASPPPESSRCRPADSEFGTVLNGNLQVH